MQNALVGYLAHSRLGAVWLFADFANNHMHQSMDVHGDFSTELELCVRSPQRPKHISDIPQLLYIFDFSDHGPEPQKEARNPLLEFLRLSDFGFVVSDGVHIAPFSKVLKLVYILQPNFLK